MHKGELEGKDELESGTASDGPCHVMDNEQWYPKS